MANTNAARDCVLTMERRGKYFQPQLLLKLNCLFCKPRIDHLVHTYLRKFPSLRQGAPRAMDDDGDLL